MAATEKFKLTIKDENLCNEFFNLLEKLSLHDQAIAGLTLTRFVPGACACSGFTKWANTLRGVDAEAITKELESRNAW